MTEPFIFDEFTVRPQVIDGIQRYVQHGVKPGHFLTAVLCNDLRESINRADDDNRQNLIGVVAYCMWEIPGACWGSKEKVDAWLRRFSPSVTPS